MENGTAEWTSQYDLDDASCLGDEATAEDMEKYNALQRDQLIARWPDGPPDPSDEPSDDDPVEAFIEAHHPDWLEQVITTADQKGN